MTGTLIKICTALILCCALLLVCLSFIITNLENMPDDNNNSQVSDNDNTDEVGTPDDSGNTGDSADNGNENPKDDEEQGDDTPKEPAEKFEASSVPDKNAYAEITLGDLFSIKDSVTLGSVSATVTDPYGDKTVINVQGSDWAAQSIKLNVAGSWSVEIKDNDSLCKVTSVSFEVLKVEKFTSKSVSGCKAYTKITLGELFDVRGGMNIGSVSATVSAHDGSKITVSGDSSEWSDKVIDLYMAGDWTVEIKDDDNSCAPTTVSFNVLPGNKFIPNSVSNRNAYTDITLGELFTVKDGLTAGKFTASISVTDLEGNTTSKSVDGNDWSDYVIDLDIAGEWTVEIADDDDSSANATVNFKVLTVQKFTGKTVSKNAFSEITLGELFTVKDEYNVGDSVTAVIYFNGNEKESKTTSDWSNEKFYLSGQGNWKVEIKDNDSSCAITTAYIEVGTAQKFDPLSISYTQNAYDSLELGQLFTAKQGISITDSVNITVFVNGAEHKTAQITDWANFKILLDSIGSWKIDIKDSDSSCAITTTEFKVDTVAMFDGKTVSGLDAYSTIKLSELFSAAKYIAEADVIVIVNTNGVEASPIKRTADDWGDYDLDLSTSGDWEVLIKYDNEACLTTSVSFNVTKVEKFEKNDSSTREAFTKITLGDLFKANNSYTLSGSITVTITVNGRQLDPVVYELTDWSTHIIDLTEAGEWQVSIIDSDASSNATTVTFTVNNGQKFTAKENVSDRDAFTSITLGELFNAKGYNINYSVTATVSVDGKIIKTESCDADWSNYPIALDAAGKWIVSIQDDDSLDTVSAEFNVNKINKFKNNFDKDFLYRVGNQNEVSFETIFSDLKPEIDLSDMNVAIDTIDGNANGVYNNGSIKFSGTGVVMVTVNAGNECVNSISLYLEVINATNITSATGTTNGGDLVLLCDVNSTSYVNYWDCTLYGNGFTYSLNGAPTAYNSKQGHGVIITNNAILDNVVIIGDVYNSYGAYSNQDYYNTAIDAVGKTTIQNCYIANCAAPVRARNDVTITNSTLYGGTVANLIINSGVVTLENVTTANYDDGRSLVGMGIVIHSDATESAKLVINGKLTQYNFISEANTPSDSYAKILYNAMFNASCDEYHFGTSPNRYVNAGIISMTPTFTADDITDNANTGYVGSNVTVNNVSGLVYTQPNTLGSVNNGYDKENDPHVSSTQGIVAPKYSFDYASKNYVEKTDGSNDYCYEEGGIVHISMDDGDTFNWDSSILSVNKNGETLSYTVTMNGEDYTNKSIAFNTAGNYTITYNYTDPYNYNVDLSTYSETYSQTVNISVSVIEKSTQKAEFTMGSSNAATEKITIDNNTYISATGVAADDSNWAYITINGQNIYYPIVAAKLTSTKGSSSYAYFPVFENAITITDYADGGKGAAFTYNSSTTTMPTTLTAVKGVYKAGTASSFIGITDGSLTQSGASAIFKWASNSTADSTPTTYNSVLCYKSPQISANRDAYITLVQYSYTDSTNATYYYYVGYTLAAFTYQVCLTPDTLITLADGSQKEIQYISVGEEVLAWNFYTGKYDAMPVSLLQTHGTGVQNVLHLYFEDGTELKVLGEHGIFDADLNTFIFIDEEDVVDYVGHSFIKQNGDGFASVKLIGYNVTSEYTTAYTILSADHYNVIAEGMFTVTPAHVGDNFFNPFDIGEDMKYDEEAVKADIEKYGLYTYEDFEHVLTYDQFVALNLSHFKVSVGKGYVTYDGLIYLIEAFINNEDFNV